MEMHDLFCYLRLLQAPGLPSEVRARMLGKLEKIVDAAVERDPARWKSYGLPPLGVVDSPASPFARAFSSAIDLNLDFLLETQDPDGSWKPTWSWGDAAPDAWETAKREWAGVLTLGALRILGVFGRVT